MRVLFLHIIFLTVFVFTIKAQPINQKFLQTHWTTENGLPQNSVTGIAQTTDGYLWLGTFGGLARFDGVTFKIYTTANTPELKSNRIHTLTTDKNGTLWIGTELGEIIYYKDGKFTRIDRSELIDDTEISDFYVDDAGLLLVGTTKGILTCKVGSCQRLIKDFHKKVGRIIKDTNGTIWIISEGFLHKIKDETVISEAGLTTFIYNIEPNDKGGLWVVKDFEVGEFKDGKYINIAKLDSKADSFSTLIAPDGSFFVSSKIALYRFKNGKKTEYKIENIDESNSREIFVDREGNIWLGRNGNGLVRLLSRRIQVLQVEDAGAQIPINSIVEARDGSIWLAGLYGLFQWKDDKFKVYYGEKLNVHILENGPLLSDDEGKVWTTTSKGIQIFQNGKFHLKINNELGDNTRGRCLFQDSRKQLWHGYDGVGVFVSDKEKILASYTIKDGLVDNSVNFISETRDGAMWFATRWGISRLKDGAFTNYKSEDGLSNEHVRDIYEDQDGTLWFATYGGGLNRFRDGKFTPITSKDGLFEDIVSRILVDPDDNFWMLGNRGIYSVNRQMLNDFADGKIKQIYCATYTTADGMITSEGNGGFQSAGIIASDGRFWFPMINGVVIIDPKQETLPPPIPIIEEVLIGKEAKNPKEVIELAASQETIEISYTGIGFRKPEHIRFRYRLKGLNDDWEEVGTRRTAYFPGLQYGDYRFQVIAANTDGVWSNYTEVLIRVNPPFYRTWWFYTILWILFFSVLYAINQYRNWYFARQKSVQEEFARKLLNAQETERRRIASEIHDNLGQQLLVIKNWAAFSLSKLSKRSSIREQLLQIDETATQALGEVRSMAKNLSPYHLDKVGLTNTIRFMVKQVADSCEIDFHTQMTDVDGVLPKEDEINFYRIVQESVNNIIRHSQATRAEVIVEQSNNTLTLTVSDNGIGFRQGEDDYQKMGLGLNGMRERTKMSDGEFSIQSAPGKGTKIIAEFKLKEAQRN